jgi:hypothetical protein
MISFRGKVIEKTTEAAENLWINYSNISKKRKVSI